MEDQVFSCVHGIVRKRGVVRAHAMGLKPGLAPRLPYKTLLYKMSVSAKYISSYVLGKYLGTKYKQHPIHIHVCT